MIDLSGLTFAQKLHKIKYASVPDAPKGTRDGVIVNEIYREHQKLRKTMTAVEAFMVINQKHPGRYKSCPAFSSAYSNWKRRQREARSKYAN